MGLLCLLALITAQPSGARSTVSSPLSTPATIKWAAGHSGDAASTPSARKRSRLKSLCAVKKARVCRKLRASARQTLTVNLGGQGAGSVAGPGISCPGDCVESYRSGTRVSLVGTPNAGSDFTGWSGACSGTGTCRVTMRGARLVTATFTPSPTSPPPPPTTYALTVTVSGGGSVAGSGISCPGDCTESYASGTQVPLTAQPSAGDHLTSWGGACSGSSATCTLTMNAARSASADFAGDPPPPPPPGAITTTPVDGGADYYSHFSNPLPSDPGFFPIGVWGSYNHTQANRDLDAAAGLNTYVWAADSSYMPAIRADGRFHVIQSEDQTSGVGSETAGWLLGDEEDMTGPDCPGALSSSLPSDGRMRFMNLGKGLALPPGSANGNWWADAAEQACWENGLDLTSNDFYWFTDPWEAAFCCGYRYGDNVTNARRADATDGRMHPHWAVVETGEPWGPSDPDPKRSILPAEIRSAVWHSIIAGARGIVYFEHSFGGVCAGDHHTIRTNCEGTRPIVTSVDQQIKDLAPILNSPTITSGVSASGPIRWMGKLTSSGAVYIFAGATTGATSGTFTVPSGTTAEVVGESRSIPIAGGTFTDSFADKNAVHIYKIS